MLAPARCSTDRSGSVADGARQGTADAERKLIREVAEGLKKKAGPATAAGRRRTGSRRERRGAIRTSPACTRTATRAASRSSGRREFEGRRLEDITPAELAQLQQARRETIDRARRAGCRSEPSPQLFWFENLNAQNSRAWLVVDPPDGKIPPQTAEAQQRAAGARRGATPAAAARPTRTRIAASTIAASRAACPGR